MTQEERQQQGLPQQDEDREIPPRGTPPEGPPEPNIPSVAQALPRQRDLPSQRVDFSEVGVPDHAGPPDEDDRGNGNGQGNSG